MNSNDIIHMAREAGIDAHIKVGAAELERFAALVVAAAHKQAEAVPPDVVRDAELDAKVAEAEARWQATIQDAARYRWLREADDDADKLIQADCRGVYLPQKEALDRRIDAALAAAPKGQP